ncbi:hypothetical protein SAMN05216566_105170 [Aureimonas phyllosphaerae]|uniref:Uncharacterized protein n=1 Tax=Aureimonas phyllosphaerae TaxID=1166078 RepID=A0A7W6BR87_9HYPH|nr:hypothetical protein [Aureimonas phyllosphaerae]MBB3960532.1 hypothetical protein [Aureimonas phyllosphaerae]SFF24252.1 hypothetical protein SAMN05216566_105170 [Aureimonas phyllosphaerae]
MSLCGGRIECRLRLGWTDRNTFEPVRNVGRIGSAVLPSALSLPILADASGNDFIRC